MQSLFMTVTLHGLIFSNLTQVRPPFFAAYAHQNNSHGMSSLPMTMTLMILTIFPGITPILKSVLNIVIPKWSCLEFCFVFYLWLMLIWHAMMQCCAGSDPPLYTQWGISQNGFKVWASRSAPAAVVKIILGKVLQRSIKRQGLSFRRNFW